MRPILFRGQVKYNGNYFSSKEWVQGSLITKTTGTYIYVIEEDNIGNITRELEVEVIPETVGQFTGLIDKNRTMIFEGDILLNSNITLLTSPDDKRLYLVKWQDGNYIETDGKIWLGQKPSFLFEKINHKGKKYMDLIFNQNQIEIVGNIHDNPELINN